MADGRRRRTASVGGRHHIRRKLAIALLPLYLGGVSPTGVKDFDGSALLGGLTEQAQRDGLLIGQQALDEWRRIFEARSLDEWGKVWHSEKHRRCYSDLRDHMEWVCRSGLSLTKRNSASDVGHGRAFGATRNADLLGGFTGRLRHLPLVFLFALRKVDNAELDDAPTSELNQMMGKEAEDKDIGDVLGPYGQPASQALQMLKYSGVGRAKRKERGIMDECCHQTDGCSWEEYTEYCHVQARNRRFIPP